MENNRIAFVIARDGIDAAKVWAQQTLAIYRSCVLSSSKRGYGVKGSKFADKKPHHASFREYRKTFIVSYLILKNFLRG